MPRLAAAHSGKAVRTAWEMRVDDHVIRLAWSPAGDLLAVACIGGPIYIIDSFSGGTVRVLEGHRFGTQCLDWSHDGRYLASGGQDGKLRIWDPNSDRALRELDAGVSWVEQVAFAPGAPLLASAAGRLLKLWNLGGEPVQTYPVHPSTIADIEWQRQGLYLTSGCYGQLATFKPDSPDPVKAFQWKGSILTVAWSPNGDYVATGNQDASVHFWYRKTGRDLEMSGYPTKVRQLTWDSDSRYLATGGSAHLIIWDCSGKGPAGTRPVTLKAHDALLSALEYQHGGGLLASGCQNGQICVWNPPRKQTPLWTCQLDGAVTQVGWSPDDRALGASSANGLVSKFGFTE
jgi:WD40 repeat protein